MIPSFLLHKDVNHFEEAVDIKRLSFIDKTIKSIATFISVTFVQWHTAKKQGLFQLLDSRVKVLFLLLTVILISINSFLLPQFVIASILLFLCIFSRLELFQVYKKIVTIGFVFGFLIFVPASLNIFTPGKTAFTLLRFNQVHHWWIYSIPQEITITNEGIYTVSRLTLKVLNSVTVVFLVASTTTFERIIKSLSFFRIPDIFLLTLTLTYKFIFILSSTIIESYHAIKMRWWNRNTGVVANEIVAGRIGYLFRKSWERYEMVYLSMTARGFTGKVNFCYLNRLRNYDYIFLVVFLLMVVLNLFQIYIYAGTI